MTRAEHIERALVELVRRASDPTLASGAHSAWVPLGAALADADDALSDLDDRCEALIGRLHQDQYRDLLKYLVLHPTADGKLSAKAEHPARDSSLSGQGDTWAEALADLIHELDQELDQ